MAATSLLVIVNAVDYDVSQGKYRATSNSVGNENETDSSIYTYFGINELPSVVNARIVADAKVSHNNRYGTNFGLLTPAGLIGTVATF